MALACPVICLVSRDLKLSGNLTWDRDSSRSGCRECWGRRRRCWAAGSASPSWSSRPSGRGWRRTWRRRRSSWSLSESPSRSSPSSKSCWRYYESSICSTLLSLGRSKANVMTSFMASPDAKRSSPMWIVGLTPVSWRVNTSLEENISAGHDDNQRLSYWFLSSSGIGRFFSSSAVFAQELSKASWWARKYQISKNWFGHFSQATSEVLPVDRSWFV